MQDFHEIRNRYISESYMFLYLKSVIDKTILVSCYTSCASFFLYKFTQKIGRVSNVSVDT
jgi:hypothetical protein